MPFDLSITSRELELLKVAKDVFLRYGFKKTTFDDLARAANLTRQGLYLYYSNKTEIFREIVKLFVHETAISRKTYLTNTKAKLETSLLEAFVISHGNEVGSHHFLELINTSKELVGEVIDGAEKMLKDDIANALRDTPVEYFWRNADVSVEDIANQLVYCSQSAKLVATNIDEYSRQMNIAIQLVFYPTSNMTSKEKL